MSKLSKEQKDWLNERGHQLHTNGRELFNSFKEEFNLETDEARPLIHAWDEKNRGIKSGKPKVN